MRYSEIQARQADRQKRTEVAQDDVVNGLLFEAKYFGVGASPAARVRSWELLGKHVGMLDERFKLEHSGQVRVNLAAISDKDLGTIETILANAKTEPDGSEEGRWC